MATILDDILATKRKEVAARKAATPEAELAAIAEQQPPARGFVDALALGTQARPAVIAEIKRASPSKGVIRAQYDVADIAARYDQAGASCLSVLTDEPYFQGSDEHLQTARATVNRPIIRKDFVVDRYQITEARALGADCVLLIAAALDIMALTTLFQHAKNMGLDALIEVHNRAELDAALSLAPRAVGINNRNLKTFEVSLDTTLELNQHIPDGVVTVAESGIHTQADIKKITDGGVYAFLVGEAFMRADDPGAALEALFGS